MQQAPKKGKEKTGTRRGRTRETEGEEKRLSLEGQNLAKLNQKNMRERTQEKEEKINYGKKKKLRNITSEEKGSLNGKGVSSNEGISRNLGTRPKKAERKTAISKKNSTKESDEKVKGSKSKRE